MQKAKAKRGRVSKGTFLVVDGKAILPPLAVPKAPAPNSETTESEPMIEAFYISGATTGNDGGPFVTPWATLEAARAAAIARMHALNLWWDTIVPGDTYFAEEIPTEDVVHPGVRVGVLPGLDDGHPPPPAGVVLIPWGDGTQWAFPP